MESIYPLITEKELLPQNEKEKRLKVRLEQLADSYLDFFSWPLKTEIIFNADCSLETISNERKYVHDLLNSSQVPPKQELIAEKMLDMGFIKIILPPLLINKKIHEVAFPVQHKIEFAAWRNKHFNKEYELEIAQCKALKDYEQKLEEQIKTLKNGTKGKESSIHSFKWIGSGGVPQQKRLYASLFKKGIIDCGETTFLKAFDNEVFYEPLLIKWKITGKNTLTSKVSVFYFIEQLLFYDLIEQIPSNAILYKMIENIFADIKGKKFNHKRLKQTNQLTGEGHIMGEQLKDIVKSLK